MHEWVPYLSVVIAAASLAYAIISGARSASSARFTQLERSHDHEMTQMFARIEQVALKVDGVEDRMTKCEAKMEHLPDKDVTHRLELSLASLRSEMQVLGERMKPVAAIADRVQEAMLAKVSL